ncbi:hypothetical protein FHK94_09480, partial [Cylindrospermopsis raciborskii CS-506_D]
MLKLATLTAVDVEVFSGIVVIGFTNSIKGDPFKIVVPSAVENSVGSATIVNKLLVVFKLDLVVSRTRAKRSSLSFPMACPIPPSGKDPPPIRAFPVVMFSDLNNGKLFVTVKDVAVRELGSHFRFRSDEIIPD